MEAIRGAGLKLGVDPLGGAAVHYWGPITEAYGLDIRSSTRGSIPTFRFMTLDHDGKIRMDCSSPYAMAAWSAQGPIRRRVRQRPRRDRHGIVTPSAGPDEPQPLPGRRDPTTC